ncbi:MAG: ATP-binding protein [Vicinamibacterales bacterium]
MSPGLHAALLRAAATLVIVLSAVILTRHWRSAAGRGHAAYGATVASWLYAMSMVAVAPSPEAAAWWSRVAMLGVGLLPGVVYHLNTETAGVGRDRRDAVAFYYVLSIAVTLAGVGSNLILAEPRRYAWGYFPGFTAWGLLPVALLLVVFVEALRLYRGVITRWGPDSGHARRARIFYRGNFVAYLAALDFLPAFGVAFYPFGFAVVAVMFTGAVLGSIRYRLIEITPEIAAATLLDTMSDAVIVVDPVGDIQLANRAAGELLASPPSALLNRPLAEAIGAAELAAAVATAVPGGPGVEVSFVPPRGPLRTVLVTGATVDNPWGDALAVVWLLRDLTDQRRAEAEKQRLAAWLRQSERMESLGVMAGGIAHQFNNALMVILGRVEEARAAAQAGTSPNPALDGIEAAVQRAATTNDRLLNYAGRHLPVDTVVDLNDLIRDSAAALRDAAGQAELVARLKADLPACVGDRTELRQVLVSLVTNAAEALPGGRGTIHLVTGLVGGPDAAGPGAALYVDIRDNGPGIPANLRERVFDPFFTTKFEGRGLGLAITQRIVARHGGRVVVCPDDGAGTCIRVQLPALGAPPVVPAPPPIVRPEADRGRALLVDDEAEVRHVVGGMLDLLGFDVVACDDGAAAVRHLREAPRRFALLVVDMTMPGMHGHDVVDEVRAIRPELPIVAISGYPAGAGGDAAAAADPRCTFLHKPFRLDGLAAAIAAVNAPARAARGTP